MLGLLVQVVKRLQLKLFPAIIAAQFPLLLYIFISCLLGALQQLLLDSYWLLFVARPLIGRFLGGVFTRRGDWIARATFSLLISRLLVRDYCFAFKSWK